MTDETLLLRQIHPAWIQHGRVTSQAFRPMPKDEYKLSVYDGDLITAEQSWKHFVGLGWSSSGVLSVSVRECNSEGLQAVSSPEVFEEHAHIDFTGLAESVIKGKAKRLRVHAVDRGWLYIA